MTVVGYTRVSTEEQGRSGLGLAAQRAAVLERFPDADVLEEVASGGRADNRPVLQKVLGELRRGDVMCVAKLDRLTRSLLDFAGIVEEARRAGWKLVVVDQGFDMTTSAGKAMAGMLAVFAEFERDLIRERARDAAAVRRAKDPVLSERERRVWKLRGRGLSQRAIAGELGLGKEQVARVLRRNAA